MNIPALPKNLLYPLALAALLVAGCNKEKEKPAKTEHENCHAVQEGQDKIDQVDHQLSKIMTIAQVRTRDDGTVQVMFNENAQLFTVKDAASIVTLKQCAQDKKQVEVNFNPWEGMVTGVRYPDANKIKPAARPIESREKAINLDATDATVLDDANRLGVLNTTTPGLVNVIPDMATAQLMFNYITQQCCAIPGPYEIDYCIPFQYAYDGCYARAHKMCWILNNTFHYDTHKIFSFANAGSDMLSVHAQKWGGCCVTWWYHVAPLVNIKTPSGVKAYVFDPAMFNQPVLLSVWLHAQENPVCAGPYAHVSMINVQPTAMYAPADGSGYFFYPDPTYWDTNNTLTNYGPLTTCW